MTAVDAVRETEELIRDYGPGTNDAGVAEVPEPLSDLVPTNIGGGILIPPSMADELESGSISGFGKCQLRVAIDGKDARGALLTANVGGRLLKSPPHYEGLVGAKSAVVNGVLMLFGKTPPRVRAATEFQHWLDLMPAEAKRDGKREHEWFVFAYPEETGSADATGLGYTIVRHVRGEFIAYRAYPLSRRHAFSRIPGLETLVDKHVVILGLGALGSRIATLLASSGVQKFHLVDRDFYDTANAVRHACGVRFFGVPKVNAVANAIIEMNPLANGHITGQIARAGAMSPTEQDELIAKMAAADLIIDATASEHAAHWVDHQCHRLKKPRVHATVTNGAWGGDVMRVIPDQTPCWVCQQVAHEMPSAEPRKLGGFFAPGCAHPSFTGNAAEVGVVADLASTMIIETLLNRPERDCRGSHIRWFARSTGGQWSPQIEVVNSEARPSCPFCPAHLKPSATSS